MRVDVPTEAGQHDKPGVYTTSKQVQAWFLRRSRDLWKKKYAAIKVEAKRLKQQVADVSQSRADWHGKAEDARRELQTLQAQIAELQARLDVPAEGPQKKNAQSSRPH